MSKHINTSTNISDKHETNLEYWSHRYSSLSVSALKTECINYNKYHKDNPLEFYTWLAAEHKEEPKFKIGDILHIDKYLKDDVEYSILKVVASKSGVYTTIPYDVEHDSWGKNHIDIPWNSSLFDKGRFIDCTTEDDYIKLN